MLQDNELLLHKFFVVTVLNVGYCRKRDGQTFRKVNTSPPLF
jgi:hypothetical protein